MSTQTAAQPSRLSDLDTIFPGERLVELEGDLSVRMRPIPLRMVSTFLGTFIKLGALSSGENLDMDLVLTEVGDQAVELLDSSMLDGNLDDLPMSAAPDLFKVLLEMNFSQEVMSKWGGLLLSLTSAVPGAQETVEKKPPKKRSKGSKMK